MLVSDHLAIPRQQLTIWASVERCFTRKVVPPGGGCPVLEDPLAMAKQKPSVTKIPFLYTAWYPKCACFLGGPDSHGGNFTHAARTVEPINHLATITRTFIDFDGVHYEPTPPYTIVKFIPVAIVDVEYHQRRVSEKAVKA